MNKQQARLFCRSQPAGDSCPENQGAYRQQAGSYFETQQQNTPITSRLAPTMKKWRMETVHE